MGKISASLARFITLGNEGGGVIFPRYSPQLRKSFNNSQFLLKQPLA
jgi:hypothetical protein